MDKKLQKLLGYLTNFTTKNPFDRDFTKYPHYNVRFARNNIPGVQVGLTANDYKNAIKFARNLLPKIVNKLPDKIVNEEITTFMFSAFKNPHIKDMSGLVGKFTAPNLQIQNAVIKLYNINIDISIDTDTFSLYTSQDFYEKFVKNVNGLPSHFKKTFTYIFDNSKNNIFVVLVLKNIPVYEPKPEVALNIIKNRMNDFCAVLGIMFQTYYQPIHLGNYIKESLEAVCLFDKRMTPLKLSDIGRPYNPFYHEPVEITKKDIETNKFIINLLSDNDNLLNKTLLSIRWLNKSILSENDEDRILQATISLETLLSRHQKSDNAAGLGVSLAETFAFLTESDLQKRLYVFKFLKNIYNIRSEIVHSGQAAITTDVYYHFYDILKDGILKIIDLIQANKWKNIDEIYKYVEQLKFQ